MALSILGGKFKGVKLDVPPENITRPTAILLRRKLFDAHQDLSGICFVDLFAGSGAMGMEALSRHTQEVILIESARKAFNILVTNSIKLDSALKKSCFQMTANTWLGRSLNTLESNHNEVIFFIDPPYEKTNLIDEVVTSIARHKIAKKSTLWIESDFQKGYTQQELEAMLQLHGCSIQKAYKQGQHFIVIADFTH